MNKQITPSITADEVAEQLDCDAGSLEYWAWPQVFGSTAGPFRAPGRIAGAAMTRFTIEAWHDGGGKAVLFCKGRVLKVTDEFQPQMPV
ncbi:hypothetical protein G3A43_07840 [Paraburkholderia aspalathi]|nr:hypothetical protein [Paraburkholderia aspalathi]MBK3780167.1 hypothetical protein [Paraburkholderia aspalathi]